MNQIKVFVVDDSLFMQKVLQDILQSDKGITIIGTARNGEEALSKIEVLHPDVVTMDIEMPRMDGLTAVQRIMERKPLPIVMISSLTQREAEITFKALEYGAVDYVPKPSGSISLNMSEVKDEVLSKIKTAALANVMQKKPAIREKLQTQTKHSEKVISMAASTGGPPALASVLKALPESIPPILVVQHMPQGITKFFAADLNGKCKFRVKEAEEGDMIQDNLALVAPGGFHMVVNKEGRISLTMDPPVNYVRPSADVTMISMAQAYGSKNIGVVLTGMGSDGARGIKAIKEKGGTTIAQDKETSVVYGMPNMAYQTGCVDTVASLQQIPHEIIRTCT